MTISAIVPIYCEEKTLKGVVESLLKSPMIDEVICVDDASEDKSLEILKRFSNRITLVTHKQNKGKGAALVSGIKRARGEIVCFVDADLLNFREEHIRKLLMPLLKGQATSTMGYGIIKVRAFINWTGERAYFKKNLLPHLKEMEKARFGVEMYLNHVFKNTKRISLPGLRGIYKNEKFGRQKFVNEYIKEALEVTKTKSRLYGNSFSKEIAGLTGFKTLDEFKAKISKVTDRDLKKFIEGYILKYLTE